MSDIQSLINKVDHNPNKKRDIAVGFFGWIIFNNIYYIFIIILSIINVALPEFGNRTLVYFGLPVVIALLVFFVKKRIRIVIGIVIAFFINVALWAIIWTILGIKPIEYEYFLLPLPLGFFALAQ